MGLQNIQRIKTVQEEQEMAEENGQQQQHRHFICNYRGKGSLEKVGFDNWKKKALNLTKNGVVVKWFTYRTPLKTLDAMGLYIMQLLSLSPFHFFASLFFPGLLLLWPSFYAIILALLLSLFCAWLYQFFDHQLRVEHAWVIFMLRTGSKISYVSLEKIRDGILFQIANDLETVKDNQRGDDRGPVEEVNSSERSGIEGMMVHTFASMELILQSEALFDAYYNVFRNNCQQTVTKLLACLVKNSLDLNFCIPGMKQSLAINDEKIVCFLEMMFPKWAKGEMQSFPEVADPFAFLVDESPNPESTNHKLLIEKQRVLNAIQKVLMEKDHDILLGQKSVFSKLESSSFKRAIQNIQCGEIAFRPSIIEHISNFWNNTLDIVVILEKIGAIIFHFTDDTQSEDHTKGVRQKMDLVAEVEKFPADCKDYLHAIVIQLTNDEETSSGVVKRTRHGFAIEMSLSDTKSDEELQNCLLQCFEQLIIAKTTKRVSFCSSLSLMFKTGIEILNLLVKGSKAVKTPALLLQRLTAKLFLLLNMENQNFLIHQRVLEQYFGPEEFCIMTPKQNQIVQAGKKMFQGALQDTVQWIVQGCAGSGKTLLLVQLAKEFVESGKDGNVFIRVDEYDEDLRKLLQEHIQQFGWESRVTVGLQPDCIGNVKLLLWDEFYFYPDGLQSYQEKFFRQYDNHNVSFILFTSGEKNMIQQAKDVYFAAISWINHVHLMVLGGNLRSSTEIAALIMAFQKFVGHDSLAGQPVASSIQWTSNQPEITFYNDGSNERLVFLQSCKVKIEHLAENHETVMVSPFCHMSLRKELENLCSYLGNVSFGYSEKVLGCQYQCMVIILDVATCIPPKSSLINSMTRATTSLHLFINESMKPIYFDEVPAASLEVCFSGQHVESRVNQLTSSAFRGYGKKALIYDFYELLPKEFVKGIKDVASATSWFWFGSEEETRQKTKEFSLVIGVFPEGNLDAELPFLFFPPYIEIMVVDAEMERKNDAKDAKDLLGWEMVTHLTDEYDLDSLRRNTVDFFKAYKESIENK